MWNPYQYRQGKLKLIKDIKTGQPHLRVSLIDHQQINDLTKIYQQRRDYYRIETTGAVISPIVQETYEQQAISNLSYKEKIELYRKRLQQQKMQHKYSNLFKKVQKKKSNFRNPVLHKLLQHFQSAQKHEQQSNIKQDIKESQKNLQMIKINSNRRAFFSQKTSTNNMTRPRFISLENSLPQKQIKSFPKWTDYAEGKYLKPDNNNKGINIIALQNNLESIITKKNSQPEMLHNNSHFKQSHIFRQKSMTEHKVSHTTQFEQSYQKQKQKQNGKQQNFIIIDEDKKRQVKTADVYDKFKQIERMDKSFVINKNSKTKTTQSKRFYKHKTNENITHAIKTFSKSQHYSKEVIDTMSGFYKTKATKKEDYQKMVFFLKNDRPFTSDIRRRNYKMVGQQNLKHVKQYRNFSQKERKRKREQNFKFYLQLLKKMQSYSIEQLPLSGKIIQKIRIILQSNYYLQNSHYQQISEPARYEKLDPMSDYLLLSIEKLIARQHKENQN